MQINVLFDSIDEAVTALQAVQEMGNAIDENGNVNGDPEPTASVTQGEPEMQEEIAQDAQDAPFEQICLDTEENSSDDNPTMEDALKELGLGFTDSHHAHPRKPACRSTLDKWFDILGYSDFKNAIGAIRSAWPKYYKGSQWNRMIVKDVCLFVKHCRIYYCQIDFDLLAYSLSHLARGSKIITPMEMRKSINQNNAGDTTLERYNAQLGNQRKPKLPPINQNERRDIENEKY